MTTPPGGPDFDRSNSIKLFLSRSSSDHFYQLIQNSDNSFQRRRFLSFKEGKDQESIQSSTTPDPGYQWESDNFTIIHHKREPRGQPFPSR